MVDSNTIKHATRGVTIRFKTIRYVSRYCGRDTIRIAIFINKRIKRKSELYQQRQWLSSWPRRRITLCVSSDDIFNTLSELKVYCTWYLFVFTSWIYKLVRLFLPMFWNFRLGFSFWLCSTLPDIWLDNSHAAQPIGRRVGTNYIPNEGCDWLIMM